MSVKIYAYPGNVNSFKALIAAEYGGVKVGIVDGFKMGVDNKTPEFLKKNPSGQVPTADTPDGPLFESNAIARYVARVGNDKGLYGVNAYEASSIDQWIEFHRSHFEKHGGVIYAPIFGWSSFDQKTHDDAVAAIQKGLGMFESALAGKNWVVGNRVTLADIVIVVSFKYLWSTFFTADFLKAYPNFNAYVNRALAEPNFAKHLADMKNPPAPLAPGALARH